MLSLMLVYRGLQCHRNIQSLNTESSSSYLKTVSSSHIYLVVPIVFWDFTVFEEMPNQGKMLQVDKLKLYTIDVILCSDI